MGAPEHVGRKGVLGFECTEGCNSHHWTLMRGFLNLWAVWVRCSVGLKDHAGKMQMELAEKIWDGSARTKQQRIDYILS